jgi:WD40 repeat protein
VATLKDEFLDVRGLAAISNSQLVAVVSNAAGNYQMCMFTFKNGSLTMAWQTLGKGRDAVCSKVYFEKYILVGARSNRVIDMWNTSTKKVERVYRRGCDVGPCQSAVVGPDGKYVVGGDENDVVVWERETGREVKRLSGHTNWVRGVVYHPSNPSIVVSYSDDNTFIVWNVLGQGVALTKFPEMSPPARARGSSILSGLFKGSSEHRKRADSVKSMDSDYEDAPVKALV